MQRALISEIQLRVPGGPGTHCLIWAPWGSSACLGQHEWTNRVRTSQDGRLGMLESSLLPASVYRQSWDVRRGRVGQGLSFAQGEGRSVP